MQWLRSYYEALDSLRFEAVARFLHEDCRSQYPTGTVLAGRQKVIEQGRKGLTALKGVRHELRHAWEEGDQLIFELEVTYWRMDGQKIVRPGLGIFVIDEGKIREQRLFVDARGVWDQSPGRGGVKG